MNRKLFLKRSLLIAGMLATSSPHTFAGKRKNSVRLIRHATLWVEINGVRLLVDPMLSPRNAMPAVQNAGNDIRIPMVELPLSPAEIDTLVNQCDVVLLTHTHRDHWDSEAQRLIPKSKQVLCQPSDFDKIRSMGFENTVAIDSDYDFKGISLSRTGGQHGTGEIGKLMGTISGYLLTDGIDKLYIAGDTIWCQEVEETIARHQPQSIVVNAGAAQFLKGEAITMAMDDIEKVLNASGKAKVIAVHMETVNHCRLHKAEVRKFAVDRKLGKRLLAPEDGESVFI